MQKFSSIRRGNSRRTSRTKRISVAVLVVGVLLVLSLVLPRIFSFATQVFWYPFTTTYVWLNESSGSLPAYFRDRRELVGQINELRGELASQSGTDLTIKRLQTENTEFRNLIGAVPGERQVARVVARPPQLPYDVVLIDRGARQGVVESAPVYLGQDQLVGFVSTVNPDTSLVTLVTHPDFSATAYIMGPDIFTLTEGVGGGVLRVRVPQGLPIKQGDVVILPAVDAGVYGSIFAVTSSPTQPEQFGYVEPAVPLQSLFYVSVGSEPIVTKSFVEAQQVVEAVESRLLRVELPPGVLVTPQSTTTPDGTPLGEGVSATTSTTAPPVVE